MRRPEATTKYSIRIVPSPALATARYALLVPLLAGVALLAAAEFSPLYEVRALDAVVEDRTAGAHHGHALLVIAAALAPMGCLALVRGSRPAAAASLVLALAAVAVVVLVDRPAVDETGIYSSTYEAAQASPQSGFWLACAGAGLALAAAVGAVVVARPRMPARA